MVPLSPLTRMTITAGGLTRLPSLNRRISFFARCELYRALIPDAFQRFMESNATVGFRLKLVYRHSLDAPRGGGYTYRCVKMAGSNTDA